MDKLRELIHQNSRLWSAALDRGVELASKTVCKRKPVAAQLYDLRTQSIIGAAINGPVPVEDRKAEHCTGEVGNCGCAHAETLVCAFLLANPMIQNQILVTSYSPCRSCANLIVLTESIVGCVYLHETENYGDGKEILERNGIPTVCVYECYDPD